ncbi:MAG: TRAP transporter large permease, partial [Gammaproteobacteria bacterium]|nr:TRAP transporter large permease [Gammaproteobacteria bacterium]
MLIMLALLLLALFGAPLFAVIGASTLLAFQGAEIDLSVMAIEIFGLAEMP